MKQEVMSNAMRIEVTKRVKILTSSMENEDHLNVDLETVQKFINWFDKIINSSDRPERTENNNTRDVNFVKEIIRCKRQTLEISSPSSNFQECSHDHLTNIFVACDDCSEEFKAVLNFNKTRDRMLKRKTWLNECPSEMSIVETSASISDETFIYFEEISKVLS